MRASLSVLAVIGAMATGALRAGEVGSASAADILAAEQRLVQSHKASQESINRLQQNVIRANAVLDEAESAFQAKTYEQALKKYREVVTLLPNPAPAVASIQNRAYDGIAACLLILARADVEAGRLDDARAKCDEALAYAPKDERVKNERRDIYALMGIELDEYGRAIIEENPAITPKFLKDVVDVRRLFQEGDDYLATGQYDAAEAKFKHVLNIDPYNKEARNKMREVVSHKMRYATKAREATRAEAMVEVDSKWEMPVLRDVEATTQAIEGGPITRSNVADIENRLRRLVVPRVSFEGAGIDEVAAFLRQQVVQLEPGRPPINFIPRIDADTPKSDVSLNLDNVPMYDVVKYAAQVANLKFRVEEYAVLFLPLTETGDQLISREYRLQPSFLSASVADQEAAAGATKARRGTRRSLIDRVSVTRETDIKAYLESKGVAFPPNSQIVFNPISNKLIVRNTPENLELIDLLVGGTEVIPQVEIATKFVEFNQEDLDELSVAMNIVKENGGSGDNNWTSAYPDQSIYSDPDSGGINPNNMDGLNNLDGLRSSADLRRNGIDRLLSDNSIFGYEGPQPNNFNFMATVFNYKADVMIRTLSQKKGTDLLSAPKVVARSGENAKIKVIRRFWYPTAFEQGELPSGQGNTGGGGGTVIVSPTLPTATPSNPTDFEEKELGVILDVRPQVGPDNYTIDMDLVPRVVEFEGFVNYGTPLGFSFADSSRPPIIMSDNFINQPVFNSREIKTSVKVYDGQTLVMGGLLREDTQVLNDKVPFFGDLPLVGRLFRSKVEQAVKKNLLIFVTPTLVTPGGELVNPPEPIVLPDKAAAQR